MTESDENLRDLYELRSMVDELIEDGLVKHWSVGEVLESLLPKVAERVGATAAFVETYGEDLKLHEFFWSADGSSSLPGREDVVAATSETRRERLRGEWSGKLVVAQHLDVAGTWFGRAGFVGEPTMNADVASRGLHAMCEVLDNHLFAIRAAREKHAVMMRLGHALRHRVLPVGLRDAVKVLSEALPLSRLLLVYVAEENAASTLHVQMFEGTESRVDTLAAKVATASEARALDDVRTMGRAYLANESAELLTHLGMKDAQEEVLINGITKSVIVGKVVATSRSGTFNTYDRELLAAFAGFIRQRVVDFNKEWRSLATSFRPDDVARLIQSDDYERRFLAPSEQTVAILYVDISGFTKLSETVLRTPARVAELVETWSRDAVDLVWQHGGVFDKMVGDCIIALFGPPFYDEGPGERLASAIRCAKDIRAMTNKLPERAGFERLREHGVAVSTGVNLAPLFVGRFGPNGNFTGFSSGMNNTARLQGCAARDEILVMEEALATLPAGAEFSFGEARTMPVKNVADPLAFRSLL